MNNLRMNDNVTIWARCWEYYPVIKIKKDSKNTKQLRKKYKGK